jgi:VWFA-related protein
MRVEAELTTAEVTVLDKKGKPVHNLKKEDFRLYEDGKQQEISSFDEVYGSTDQEPNASLPDLSGKMRRGKTVLILFDDRTSTPANLKKTRDSAERFVKEHMRTQDLFAVFSNGLSFQVLQNFTGDPEKIVAAIRRRTVPGGMPSSMGSRTVSGSGVDFIRSLDYLGRSLESIRGRKSVLLFSENLISTHPDSYDLFLKAVNSAKKANAVFFTIEAAAVRSFQDGALGGQGYLRSLASNTGGSSIYDVIDLDKALDELDQQLSSYYILGFQSGNPKRDGSFRKLEVKTDLKNISLQFRKGYVDRRPLDTLASSRQEKLLLGAIASPSVAAQLPVAFRALYFYDSPRLARVVVTARIRLDKVESKRRGGQSACDLNVMGVAYTENDNVAARFTETVRVAVDRQKGENSRNDFIYTNYFKLRPGKYRLKIAASDEANNLGSMEHLVEIPAIPENGFAGSSLVVAEGASPLPELIQNLEAAMMNDADPLIYAGLQVSPSVENKIPVKSLPAVLFKLYNPGGDVGHWKAVAKAKLLRDGGEELSLPPISLERNLSQTGNSEVTIALNLPFQGVAPGKYRLVVEITEAESSRSTSVQTDLEFTAD